MRILYITTEIPYPLTSGFLRHYHFLTGLGRRHRITHLSLTKKPVISDEAITALSPYVERMQIFGTPKQPESWLVKSIGRMPVIGRKPQRALRLRWAALEMKRVVQELIARANFDVVVFSGKNTLPAIEDLKGVPIVADCCDATSGRVAGEIRYAGLGKKLWLMLRLLEVSRIEKKIVSKTPYLAFASDRDRALMLGESKRGEIIPQAVDVEYWRRSSSKPAPGALIFTGVMSYAPNHDAAVFLIEKILPIVRRALPQVELIIAGRDPLPELQAIARRDPKITVTGFVEDLRPYLERATVYAAPIRFASGVQNKVLEALAMELPVVTTALVAEGLRLPGISALPLRIADEENKFAEALLELLQNDEKRTRLSTQSRRFVEQHFTWPANIQKLERLCLMAADEGKKLKRNPVLRKPVKSDLDKTVSMVH